MEEKSRYLSTNTSCLSGLEVHSVTALLWLLDHSKPWTQHRERTKPQAKWQKAASAWTHWTQSSANPLFMSQLYFSVQHNYVLSSDRKKGQRFSFSTFSVGRREAVSRQGVLGFLLCGLSACVLLNKASNRRTGNCSGLPKNIVRDARLQRRREYELCFQKREQSWLLDRMRLAAPVFWQYPLIGLTGTQVTCLFPRSHRPQQLTAGKNSSLTVSHRASTIAKGEPQTSLTL